MLCYFRLTENNLVSDGIIQFRQIVNFFVVGVCPRIGHCVSECFRRADKERCNEVIAFNPFRIIYRKETVIAAVQNRYGLCAGYKGSYYGYGFTACSVKIHTVPFENDVTAVNLIFKLTGAFVISGNLCVNHSRISGADFKYSVGTEFITVYIIQLYRKIFGRADRVFEMRNDEIFVRIVLREGKGNLNGVFF